MTEQQQTLDHALKILGNAIAKLHEEYNAVHKLECEMLDRKIELNKRINKLRREVSPELWQQAYDKAMPTRRYDIR